MVFPRPPALPGYPGPRRTRMYTTLEGYWRKWTSQSPTFSLIPSATRLRGALGVRENGGVPTLTPFPPPLKIEVSTVDSYTATLLPVEATFCPHPGSHGSFPSWRGGGGRSDFEWRPWHMAYSALPMSCRAERSKRLMHSANVRGLRP